MTGLEFLGMAMLLVMLAAIFIGLPISFTLLFLALIFGYFGLGGWLYTGIHGGSFPAERIAGRFSLNHDEHALADAGSDRIDGNQRHTACRSFERQRLHQQQLRPFELPVFLCRDDGSYDAADLHISIGAV